MATLIIKANGVRVGKRTDAGAYLDKAALRALRPDVRAHVYLQMVYPAARRLVCIARLCGVLPKKIWNALARGKALGHIEQCGKGRYRATRPQEDEA